MTDSLGAHLRAQWGDLLVQGFHIAEEDSSRVALDSGDVRVVASASLLGEVDVTAAPLGSEWPRQWTWSGMVGRASVARLLELALEQLRAEPAILSGDAAFYDSLAAANEQASIAYTRWAEGKGPRPSTRRLP
jgi:hypothetical protein